MRREKLLYTKPFREQELAPGGLGGPAARPRDRSGGAEPHEQTESHRKLVGRVSGSNTAPPCLYHGREAETRRWTLPSTPRRAGRPPRGAARSRVTWPQRPPPLPELVRKPQTATVNPPGKSASAAGPGCRASWSILRPLVQGGELAGVSRGLQLADGTWRESLASVIT